MPSLSCNSVNILGSGISNAAATIFSIFVNGLLLSFVSIFHYVITSKDRYIVITYRTLCRIQITRNANFGYLLLIPRSWVQTPAGVLSRSTERWLDYLKVQKPISDTGVAGLKSSFAIYKVIFLGKKLCTDPFLVSFKSHINNNRQELNKTNININ